MKSPLDEVAFVGKKIYTMRWFNITSVSEKRNVNQCFPKNKTASSNVFSQQPKDINFSVIEEDIKKYKIWLIALKGVQDMGFNL